MLACLMDINCHTPKWAVYDAIRCFADQQFEGPASLSICADDEGDRPELDLSVYGVLPAGRAVIECSHNMYLATLAPSDMVMAWNPTSLHLPWRIQFSVDRLIGDDRKWIPSWYPDRHWRNVGKQLHQVATQDPADVGICYYHPGGLPNPGEHISRRDMFVVERPDAGEDTPCNYDPGDYSVRAKMVLPALLQAHRPKKAGCC